jgi:RNA polymerase sigma-70 factor (ECF subfamily)
MISLPPLTDEDLLHRLQQGDPSALPPLIERHHSPLIGYLYRLTNGDRALAEDLVQDSFTRLLTTLSSYQYPRPVKPYLYQIATNLARDHYRSAHTRRNIALPDEQITSDFDLEQSVEDQLSAQQAADSLHRLPPFQREVILLRYFNDLSLAEIADALNIPVGTVKSRLSNGLRQLREWLTPPSGIETRTRPTPSPNTHSEEPPHGPDYQFA